MEDEVEYAVDHGWLVEVVHHHTCGAGNAPLPHEPGCGLVPIATIEDLLAAHAARTAPETVALDVETVARALLESAAALTGDSEGTPTFYSIHADDIPHMVSCVLALAADPRRTEAEVKAEAWAEGEWAGRQNASEVLRYAHWSHTGPDKPSLLTNPYTSKGEN